MKLYEIKYEIAHNLENAFDPDTGELIDPNALERIELLEGDLTEKVCDIACWILDEEYEVEKHAKEEAKQKKKKLAAARRVESLKAYLIGALDNDRKYTDSRVSVSFRKSESVDVEQSAPIPDEFWTIHEEVKYDKLAIKRALKSGMSVPGCQIVEKQNIQIK